MPENEDAEKIFTIVSDQYIMGQAGPIALNQMAIHEAMKLYEIENKIDTFEKIVDVGRYFVNKWHEDAAEQS